MFAGMDWKDTLERLLWTFVEAFVGGLIAGSFLDIDTVIAAAVAGIAAALTVVKEIASRRLTALAPSRNRPPPPS